MKKTIIAFIILINILNVKAQITSEKLVGTWQLNNSQVASALHENYRFFQDGSFVYYFDSYNDSKRIISISGTYKILKNVIEFKILSRKEIVGGRIVKASEGFQNGWVLVDGIVKDVEQPESEVETCSISTSDSTDNTQLCIKINNDKYFRVSKDPKFE